MAQRTLFLHFSFLLFRLILLAVFRMFPYEIKCESARDLRRMPFASEWVCMCLRRFLVNFVQGQMTTAAQPPYAAHAVCALTVKSRKKKKIEEKHVKLRNRCVDSLFLVDGGLAMMIFPSLSFIQSFAIGYKCQTCRIFDYHKMYTRNLAKSSMFYEYNVILLPTLFPSICSPDNFNWPIRFSETILQYLPYTTQLNGPLNVSMRTQAGARSTEYERNTKLFQFLPVMTKRSSKSKSSSWSLLLVRKFDDANADNK